MKPAFALDFRNDTIALLHRSSGGWLVVGRVSLNEPDLPEALSYLRATALGLSPRGLATKLILPDDQILVTTVDAPGPDEASRLAQIRAALEGRTPYAVEDLVFDWELVDGTVHVAVVARDTLDEAESFATEHRFNAVAFAAVPAKGYVGEAFFGPTGQATTLLSAGKTVERDAKRTVIVERSGAAETNTIPVESPTEVVPPSEEASPDLDTTPIASLEAPGSATGADASPAALAEPVEQSTFDPPASILSDTQPEPNKDPVAETPKREMPLFGLADDEAPASALFRAVKEAEPEAAPADGVAGSSASVLDAAMGAASQPSDTEQLATLPVAPDAHEAPMAIDVEVDETEEAKANQTKGAPEAARDDVAPVSGYASTLGFASRRASADPALNAKPQTAPQKPTVDRPTAARPLVAAPLPKAERPVLNRPTAARPVAPKESKGLRGLGAFVTAPGIPGTRKKPVEPIVTRPTIAPSNAAPGAVPAPAEAATGLGRKLGARPLITRGKPRHLGLILTGLLLLVLAVIAAWSTSLAFRSDDSTATEFATAEPTTALPAIEDEMLADGQDPDLMTDEERAAALPSSTEVPVSSEPKQDQQTPVVASTETAAAPPPATETPGGTESNPGAASGDEIFLAAKDIAPVTPEATNMAAVSAQSDPLPNAQAPPPPFGTVYQFDTNGLIVPTPEGIITPEGVLLVAGKPARLPLPRPVGLNPPAATEAPAATDTIGVSSFVSDPALAEFRPRARPAGLTPPPASTTEPAPTTADQSGQATPSAVTDPVPSDEAAFLPAADSRLAGLRPMARPEAVLAAGDAARAAAAASLAAQAEALSEANSATASISAVAISRRPQPRPSNLSSAVEAAVAAAIRAPEPTPEPQEEQLSSAQPAETPEPQPEPEAESPAAKTAPLGRDGEMDIYEEPEVDGSAMRGTASASVAKQATFRNALALDKIALIGVYGTPSKRYAMVRGTNGKYKKVKVGDRIDGGKIQAITATEVRYQKGSRLLTLSLPKG